MVGSLGFLDFWNWFWLSVNGTVDWGCHSWPGKTWPALSMVEERCPLEAGDFKRVDRNGKTENCGSDPMMEE